MKNPNHEVDKWRLNGMFASLPGDPNGAFNVFIGEHPAQSIRWNLMVISSNGGGWDHVSVSSKMKLPTWGIMCEIKDLFFRPEDCVVQFHPPKKDYVNIHNNCLHLWRPQTQEEIDEIRTQWGKEWVWGDLKASPPLSLPPVEFV